MLIAQTRYKDLGLLPSMATRHGLITGSTGSGKTTTLRVMAEGFSKLGVPVFLADVKGDLSGIAVPGYSENDKNLPTLFWDVFGNTGHPLRTTMHDLGPLLLARLLDLNKVQTGVITLAFKVCEDYLDNSVLLNTKDLKAILKHLADHAYDFTTEYGNITYTSVGAIQRAVLELQVQDVDKFFNLPKFDINDFFNENQDGKGYIHVLNAKIIITRPKLYTTMLLWLLSELYEKMPECGDLEKPRFVFFFDEAHLLFKDMSKVLLDKVEQTIRLVRSKGVGIFFITQSPLDIPKTILGQLGNRVQHSLRAFTPEDFTAVSKIAKTFRQNKDINLVDCITSMGTGEALVSFLQEDGTPAIVERAKVVMPETSIKPLTDEQINIFVKHSPFFGKYETAMYNDIPKPIGIQQNKSSMWWEEENRENFAHKFGRSVVKTMGNQVGRQFINGIFHTFFKGIRSGTGR